VIAGAGEMRRFGKAAQRSFGFSNGVRRDMLRATINCTISPAQIMRVLVFLLSIVCATPAWAQPPQIAIALRDHQFAPAEVTAPAGVKFELRVHNEQKTSAEFESSSLHREQVVTPGATITVYLGPLSVGSYEFFDDFHPATRGHLVVEK
jgi:hypothetical protein